MRRFFALLLVVVVLAGCQNREQPDGTAVESGVVGQALGVPMPTAEILAALGPENDIPIHRLLPDPFFVVVGKPKQFLDAPVSAGGEWFIASTIARMLQYDIDPNSIERFVQSTGIPATILVNVPNPQNPTAMPQMSPFPIQRRATVLTFNTAVDRSLLAASLLGFNPEPAFLDSLLRQTEGRNAYYDLTPPNIGIPQRLAFGMIDERTAVIVEGLEDDIRAVFSDAVPDNAVLNRIKRTPVDVNDLTILTSLEGPNISADMLENLLAPLSEIGYIPVSFVEPIKQHLRALTISLNTSAAVGQPIISVYVEGRDEQGAETIGREIRGVIIHAQTTMLIMSEDERQMLPIPSTFAVSLLNAMTVEVNGTRINAALNNFETLIPTVNEWISNYQAAIEQEMLESERIDQLRMLSELSAAYYMQHGRFPADILDAEGNPLLSWRVALLPMMGLEDFYNEFNLDEPWDSETNLELMDTMPMIFHPIVPEVPLPKTVVRFFDSPGTPLSNRDLKLEDLELPHTTLMFIIVSPEYAVEWTKPESLEFNIDTIADIAGEQFFGITFARQIALFPVLPETYPQFEDWKRTVEALIRGTPLDPQVPEGAP